MDDVETVDRILAPNHPKDNKAVGGFLVGLLATEVNAATAQNFVAEYIGN